MRQQPALNTMRIVTAAVILATAAYYCQGQGSCQFTPEFHGATNRALRNRTFQQMPASSPVICGRDCSMNRRCLSFNYQANSRVCELNAATRAQSPAEDFIEVPRSIYFDDDGETPHLSARCAPTSKHKSCQSLFEAGHSKSSVYTIYPTGRSKPCGVRVYCDMETDRGWIVFQKKQGGTVNFCRSRAEYTSGFGELTGDFWLGNKALRDLTVSGHWMLRVNWTDRRGNMCSVECKGFRVPGENSNHGNENRHRSCTMDYSSTDNMQCDVTTEAWDGDGSPSQKWAQWLNGRTSDSDRSGKCQPSFHPGALKWYGCLVRFLDSAETCSMKIREM